MAARARAQPDLEDPVRRARLGQRRAVRACDRRLAVVLGEVFLAA